MSHSRLVQGVRVEKKLLRLDSFACGEDFLSETLDKQMERIFRGGLATSDHNSTFREYPECVYKRHTRQIIVLPGMS